MFMDMRETLLFLAELEANNNRDWFHQNKERYRQATLSFEELVRRLALEIGRFEPGVLAYEPSELTFRLTRDTRFSHDKSPYLPAFRAHISAGGKLPVPVGCYVAIRPGDRSFLGGGLFTDMFADATASIRAAIAQNGDEWTRIVSAPEFSELFTLRGAKLKNVPKGFDPAHPQAEYLKYKSWYLEYPVSDAQLCERDFIVRAARAFERMQPFHLFLNHALKDFQMPSRPKA